MDPISLTIAGLGALGGLFSNKGSQTTQTQEQNQFQEGFSKPVYDQKTGALRDYMINLWLDQLQGGGDFANNYLSGQLQTIGNEERLGLDKIGDVLASRGIRGPAAGSALSKPIINASNQRAQAYSQTPLLMDQRWQGILSGAGNFLNSLPLEQQTQTKGSSSGKTVGTQPGNMLGGLFGNSATLLAGLMGKKSATPTTGGGNTSPIGSYKFPSILGR